MNEKTLDEMMNPGVFVASDKQLHLLLSRYSLKQIKEIVVMKQIVQEMVDHRSHFCTKLDPFQEEIICMVEDLPSFQISWKHVPLLDVFVPGSVTIQMVKKRKMQIGQFYYAVVEALIQSEIKPRTLSKAPRAYWFDKCEPYKNRITMMLYALQNERRLIEPNEGEL